MRLSPLDREDLSTEQQAVLDAIEQGPRGASNPGIGMIGPFGCWVRAPKVGHAVQALGEAIRFDGSLPENIKEVAICTVGIHYRSKFEFSAHRRLALKAGVAEAALDQMVAGESPVLARDELLSFTIASQLVNQHDILDGTYALGVDAFGEEGMIELVATIGYYCLISTTRNAVRIPPADGMRDPFPEDET